MERSPNTLQNRDASRVSASLEENRPYLFGIIGGLLAGVFGAYVYKRASVETPAGRKPVSTGQMFTIIMAVLGLVRQIAEMGKQPDKKK